jgi:hypothetical protein
MLSELVLLCKLEPLIPYPVYRIRPLGLLGAAGFGVEKGGALRTPVEGPRAFNTIFLVFIFKIIIFI